MFATNLGRDVHQQLAVLRYEGQGHEKPTDLWRCARGRGGRGVVYDHPAEPKALHPSKLTPTSLRDLLESAGFCRIDLDILAFGWVLAAWGRPQATANRGA